MSSQRLDPLRTMTLVIFVSNPCLLQPPRRLHCCKAASSPPTPSVAPEPTGSMQYGLPASRSSGPRLPWNQKHGEILKSMDENFTFRHFRAIPYTPEYGRKRHQQPLKPSSGPIRGGTHVRGSSGKPYSRPSQPEVASATHGFCARGGKVKKS